ncbi:DUF547 domain-containing protein [Flagellimonas myxillae]|uniref:DUF547 domain-containing protein n=1 Tax=Flagellimonas myxillae TaxID=2942214 RepID=UPI00201F68C4|nr:DUF547 domain-containing protein [Muricauda myxillae]MCL6267639.1 DUF547 domain-containing protein [Muricauda myxillae]
MGLSLNWPLIFLLVWSLGAYPSSDSKVKQDNPIVHQIDYPSHQAWGDLLKKYVDGDGNVDYLGFKGDVSQLDSYLLELSLNPPTTQWDNNQKLAFYINLYNAATVKLIVDHYPIGSIRDIPSRWKKKWIALGDRRVSLGYVEHQILRKMGEPRIHFAINCASHSCPKLLNVPFTAQSMERLLSKSAVDFVNDKKRNRFEGNRAYLSKIFRWFKGDFTEDESLLGFINQYLDNPAPINAQIEFLDYDWSLNEVK